MKERKTKKIILCSLFTAIIAVCSWITIPFAVPFTLQTFAVFAALRTLGGKYGTVSIGVYILLGAVGIPVFSGFKGGVGVLFGVTGGYIFGFLASGIFWWLTENFSGKILDAVRMTIGLFLCYIVGTAWFTAVYAENISVITAMKWCVIPFILPDLVKIYLAMIISEKIKPVHTN